ncbi:MAG: hypothetical protein M1831_000095 [Alyxoria varia]|nr:MAG: hypothetical protein M1831_000095 [Alyxoria varia]
MSSNNHIKPPVDLFECGHVQLLSSPVEVRNNTNRRQNFIVPIATDVHPETHLLIHNRGPCPRYNTEHPPQYPEFESCQTAFNPPAPTASVCPAYISPQDFQSLQDLEISLKEWWKEAVDYISVLHGIDERIIRAFQRIPYGGRPLYGRLPTNLRGLYTDLNGDFIGPTFDFTALEEVAALFEPVKAALDNGDSSFDFTGTIEQIAGPSTRLTAYLEEDAKFMRALHNATSQCSREAKMEETHHEYARPADPREPFIHPPFQQKRCDTVIAYYFVPGQPEYGQVERDKFTMAKFDVERHIPANRALYKERDLTAVRGWEMVLPTDVDPDEGVSLGLWQRRMQNQIQQMFQQQQPPPPQGHGGNAGQNGNADGDSNSSSSSSSSSNNNKSNNKRKRTQQDERPKRRKTTSNPDSSAARDSTSSNNHAEDDNQDVANVTDSNSYSMSVSSGYDIPLVENPETVPGLTSTDVHAYMDNTDGELPRRGDDPAANWNVPNFLQSLGYSSSSSSSSGEVDLPYPFTFEFLNHARCGDTLPQPYYNPVSGRVDYGFALPTEVEAEMEQARLEGLFDDLTPMDYGNADLENSHMQFAMQDDEGRGVLGVAALPREIADIDMMEGVHDPQPIITYAERSFYDDHPEYRSFAVPEPALGAVQEYHNRVQGVPQIGMLDVGRPFDVWNLSRDAFDRAGGDDQGEMTSAWQWVYEKGTDLADVADPTAKLGVVCGGVEGFDGVEL